MSDSTPDSRVKVVTDSPLLDALRKQQLFRQLGLSEKIKPENVVLTETELDALRQELAKAKRP